MNNQGSKNSLSSSSFSYKKQKNVILRKYGSEYNLHSQSLLKDNKQQKFNKRQMNENKKLLPSLSFNFESNKCNETKPEKFFSSFDDDLLLNKNKEDKTGMLRKYNFKTNSSKHSTKDRRNLFKNKQICEIDFNNKVEEKKVENLKDSDKNILLTNGIDETLNFVRKANRIAENSTSTETLLSEDDNNSQLRLRNSKTSSSLRVKLLYKKALKKALEYNDKIEYTLDLASKSKICDLPIKSILNKL